MARKLKVVFCWEEVNGYMAACWRALQARGRFDVSIIGGRPGTIVADNKYSEDLTQGLDAHLFGAKDLHNVVRMQALFSELNPDIIFIPGWSLKGLTALTRHPDYKHCKFIMGFDTPRLDTWRQKLAWVKIGRLVSRMAAVAVPGERGFQFASQLLRVPEHKIWKGLYGFDYQSFSKAMILRKTNDNHWPKRFLYLGRFVKVKGVDILLEAYAKYRKTVSQPWGLWCYGSGRISEDFKGRDGVDSPGFAQPSELCDIFSRFGAFILPSRIEPWGVVIGEAASSGLPIICTHACGASVELVRPFYNGLLVETENVDDLTRKMIWVHKNHRELPGMGARSQELARAFSADAWAERWEHYLDSLGS